MKIQQAGKYLLQYYVNIWKPQENNIIMALLIYFYFESFYTLDMHI